MALCRKVTLIYNRLVMLTAVQGTQAKTGISHLLNQVTHVTITKSVWCLPKMHVYNHLNNLTQAKSSCMPVKVIQSILRKPKVHTCMSQSLTQFDASQKWMHICHSHSCVSFIKVWRKTGRACRVCLCFWNIRTASGKDFFSFFPVMFPSARYVDQKNFFLFFFFLLFFSFDSRSRWQWSKSTDGTLNREW